MIHLQGPSSNQCQGKQRVKVNSDGVGRKSEWLGQWYNVGHPRDLLSCLGKWSFFKDSRREHCIEGVRCVPLPCEECGRAGHRLWRIPALLPPALTQTCQSYLVATCPRVVPKSMFEELMAMGSKVCPPFQGRGSQEAAEEHSVWKHLQSHFGLNRSTELVTSWLEEKAFPSHACSHPMLAHTKWSSKYITWTPFPVVFQAPQHHKSP